MATMRNAAAADPASGLHRLRKSGSAGLEAALRVLLVEDEPCMYEPLCEVLEEAGHQVIAVPDAPQAEARLRDEAFDLLVTDVRLPRGDGLSLFRSARRRYPDMEVIIMSAYASVADAAAAMRDSALYFFEKPFPLDLFRRTVAEVAQRKLAQAWPVDDQTADWLDRTLVGNTPPMQRLKRQLRSIANSEATVLVHGESGTGKEVITRALHELGPRREGPFVPVNCAAFPDTLLESELFGHERGAFTGAVRRREGRFRAAQGGTLFLDEVADMSPLVQAKLLRVLEDGCYEPLGTNQTTRADVRVVSATNASLRQRVAEGRFRSDLYYRLKVFEIHAPALRDRRADIPALVAHFMETHGRPPLPFSSQAWHTVLNYSYPGNVRELRHAIEHALVMCGGDEIRLEHLPAEMVSSDVETEQEEAFLPLQDAARDFERQYLLQALARCAGNRGETARLLGIARKTLWEKMRRHGLADR